MNRTSFSADVEDEGSPSGYGNGKVKTENGILPKTGLKLQNTHFFK
jgi:hypothetical protein